MTQVINLVFPGENHILDEFCWCGPSLTVGDYHIIYEHYSFRGTDPAEREEIEEIR